MLRDRSSEFRRKVAENENRAQELISMGSEQIITEPSRLFFAEIDEIRKLILNLAEDVRKVEAEQSNILAQTVVQDVDKNRMDVLISEVRHRARILKPRLMKMKTDLEDDSRRVGEINKNAIDYRMRRHHIEILMKKLSDILDHFNRAELTYKERVKKRIKRQLDLAGRDISEEEINEMIESKSTQVFNWGLTSNAVRLILNDASSRHNEILKLEESISELSDLYNDLVFLIQTQGNVVENIDHNVEDAAYYVEEGNKQARIAVEYKKGAIRKKVILVSAIFILFLIIIFVALYLILKHK